MWVTATPHTSCSVNSSDSSSSTASTAEATAGHDVSSYLGRDFADDSREECALSELQARHWVRVQRLDGSTTPMQLHKMFYPHGGDDAIVVVTPDDSSNSNSSNNNNNGTIGFVSFMAREMAVLAVEKMDAFVPCEQTQALRVCVVTPECVAAAWQRSVVPPRSYNRNATRPVRADAATAPCVVTTTTSPQQQPPPPSSSASPWLLSLPSFLSQLQTRLPTVVAAELAAEVRCAQPATLTHIVAMLAQLPTTWTAREALLDALLKQLLCMLLDRTACDVVQAANCGAVTGSMFARGFVPGDPFQLASRLLQHGVCSAAQVEGICAIAHVCDALPHVTMSRAAFWALVSRTAVAVDNAAVRTSLLAHLRQLGVSAQASARAPPPPPPPPYTRRTTTSAAAATATTTTLTPQPSSLSSSLWGVALVDGAHAGNSNSSDNDDATAAHSSDCASIAGAAASHNNNGCGNGMLGGSHATSMTAEHVLLQQQRQQDEAKRRTVYLSHLPPLLPQATLMKLLTCAGPVNKVRVCAGNGYSTLFAFVEMRTPQGAKACMRLNDMCILDHRIRVQSARNAIQDVVGDDAVYGFAGCVVQPCLFGSSDEAIAECVGSTTPPR